MTRPDIRKGDSEFVQRAVRNLRRVNSLGSVTRAIPKPRTFLTIDGIEGLTLLVANVSNTINNRAKAERIIGGPVKTLWEDSTGTVWRKAS
jgi:hypothetical protein